MTDYLATYSATDDNCLVGKEFNADDINTAIRTARAAGNPHKLYRWHSFRWQLVASFELKGALAHLTPRASEEQSQ